MTDNRTFTIDELTEKQTTLINTLALITENDYELTMSMLVNVLCSMSINADVTIELLLEAVCATYNAMKIDTEHDKNNLI